MLVLLETPAGYGLFKVTNSKILECNADQVSSYFEDSAMAKSSVALKSFMKFKSSDDALKEANALMDSKLGKGLKKFLTKNIVKGDLREEVAISDKLLGVEVQNKLNIQVIYNPNTLEIVRGIRLYFHDLVSGLSEEDTNAMALSLSHSLTRFRLKFSPDKVDIMIVQAIGLLDDLDREINKFGMRLKEWYGWHFPELTKIVPDTLLYAKVVKLIGVRTNAKTSDLASILPTDLCSEIHQAAEISMGSEIFPDDLESITELAVRLEELIEYRGNLEEYLKYRMNVLAPNLTYMVGELIGARLLSHAGSLMSLAKHPASTIQILGAEKALFRALKSKSSTPKYGLIYHASLVGQSTPKLKGKISRILAAKLALCIRVDALKENETPTVAIENKKYVENRLQILSSQGSNHIQEVRSKTPYRPSWESNEQNNKKKKT
ncbi:nucleolar protein Nop5, putative [Theileria equi strain WA]|uniref:Nucleolar protein Nop5, putative n=1 Tax=Theileria equi strain WA TaxID=1537102 RepID=L0AX74_THEEQ|nr:nucleolar protein Nop5, putative [Theileria equi strain WA]AFZ79489.1 nucleolar protein Nop5, putative [Theileria equi strain WA]|eukprot:XP_004829155.1 nucleolar protein Nop5, putative [Theileria equi strain WA]